MKTISALVAVLNKTQKYTVEIIYMCVTCFRKRRKVQLKTFWGSDMYPELSGTDV